MSRKRPFTPIKSTDIKPRVSALIYGFPGAGKTFLARSLVEDQSLLPAIIIVCDAGEMTLRDLADDDKFMIIRGDLNTLSDVYNYVDNGKSDIKSIFIDNLTELHRTALLERAKISSAGKSRSEYELTQNDYGVARNQILHVVSLFATRLADINVFATALAVHTSNEITGSATIEPDLAGKLAYEVPGYFDLVGYLSVETPRGLAVRKARERGEDIRDFRQLVVNQTSTIPIARNRGGAFMEDLADPKLSDIVATMRQGRIIQPGMTT